MDRHVPPASPSDPVVEVSLYTYRDGSETVALTTGRGFGAVEIDEELSILEARRLHRDLGAMLAEAKS